MLTTLDNVIEELTRLRSEIGGEAHVRIMGEPLAGASVRKVSVFYADRVESHYEVNFVGRAFDGILMDCEQAYRNLNPIPKVAELIKKL
jgi:hypothetical protein